MRVLDCSSQAIASTIKWQIEVHNPDIVILPPGLQSYDREVLGPSLNGRVVIVDRRTQHDVIYV